MLDVADKSKGASDDDSSHRVPDETQTSARPEFHVFEEAVQLDGQALPQTFYRFLCFALIRRADEHSAAILNFEARLEQCEVLSRCLIAVHKDDNVLAFMALRYAQLTFSGLSEELRHNLL